MQSLGLDVARWHYIPNGVDASVPVLALVREVWMHILSGVALLYIPQVNDPITFYYVIFAAMICYMPTISLSNFCGVYHLEKTTILMS